MTLIADPAKNGLYTALQFVWDPIALDYVVATQAGGGGGGGGGAVTVANGADVAQGATTDAETTAGNGSIVSMLKRLRHALYDDAFIDVVPVGIALTVQRNPNKDMRVVSDNWPMPINAPGGIAISSGDCIVHPMDSGGALYDIVTKAQLPAALSGAGNLKVSIAEDGGAVIGVDDNGASLTTDTPQLPAALVAGRLDVNVGASVALATTAADGADVTQGAKADAVWDGVTVATTISAVLKYVGQKIEAVRALLAGTMRHAKREIGYANVSLYAEAVAGIIAETAITINKSLNFAAAAASTSNGASVGKELVIYGIVIGWVATTTTANTARVRIRVNPAGAAIITSPIAFTMRIGWESATFIANEEELQPILFAEPIVIPNPGTFMATIACVAANGTLDVQLLAYERTP